MVKLSFDQQYNLLYEEHKLVSYDTKHFEYTQLMILANTYKERGFRSTWTKKRKSAFIKSILVGCPQQKITGLFKGNNLKDAYLLDGSNRLSVILEFVNNELKLNDNTILPEFNGLKYGDLSSHIKRTFIKNCEMRVISVAAKTVPLLKNLGLIK